MMTMSGEAIRSHQGIKEYNQSSLLNGHTDLEVLREFEPIIRYTRGERFFPIDVKRYVDECSLWMKSKNLPPRMIVEQGMLTLDSLAKYDVVNADQIIYLKFIEPLDLIEHTRYSLRKAIQSLRVPNGEDRFRTSVGRLTRVGYTSRFIDALFSLSLVWRGRVPGDTALAAELTYELLQKKRESYTYYGRIIRENGWIILQYWYFYPFNNWRSGFDGVNDHEGDWEMVCVYCYEEKLNKRQNMLEPDKLSSRLVPCWVAYASHDFSGDDLRRRWDDDELEKVGNHPIVYAGAGSHASYFSKGEYMAEIELPFLVPLVRLVDRIQNFWINILRQAGSQIEKSNFNVFRIPFIDYARGDGTTIGINCDLQWEAQLINQYTSWAVGYRGLWGLFAQDPIAGENAPAGPVYTRDGHLRRRWIDPLGWVGLDKTPPPNRELKFIAEQKRLLRNQLAQLSKTIKEKSEQLNRQGVEASGLMGIQHQEELIHHIHREISSQSKDLIDLRTQLELGRIRLMELETYRKKVLGGYTIPARAHINHAHTPLPEVSDRISVMAEFFAAVNIGVLIVASVLILIFAQKFIWYGLAAIVASFLFLEAIFRRRFTQLVNGLAIGLAIICALLITYEFFWQIIVIGVLVAGFFVMWENLRQLRS